MKATTMTRQVTYRSQSVDYLGFLEAKLRDLRGIATLIHELLQNADDVHDEEGKPAATRITFDVCDDALIVENDGVFREVDFERVSNIASGGKREEEGTTGAFGIGFISVYQITDHPEIYSSGRRWILRPDAPEAKRIEDEEMETTATRFRLPWAFDPNTEVRQKLRIEAVKREALDGYLDEMSQALSGAALFLKQLAVLELKRSGILVKRIKRDVDDAGTIRIQDGTKTQVWRVLRGSFASEAQQLRATFSQIEAKRHSNVLVAVADDPRQAGRLYAVLPIPSSIPVPFHINADFFPSTDRKRIVLDNGYQRDWNRAALEAAAQTLARHLDGMRELLGHNTFWSLIKRLEDARRDEVFGQFWQNVEAILPHMSIVYTSDGRWLKPGEARLLESAAEQAAEPVFRTLGIATAHSDLRPYYGLMRQREIGTPLLNIPDVVAGLRRVGLDRTMPASRTPGQIKAIRDSVPVLWPALDAVWERQSASEKQANRASLSECAVALDTDNMLHPPAELYRADKDAREIFPLCWLRPDLPADRMPGMLVREFDAFAAVEHLEKEAENLNEQWKVGELHPARIYHWLEGRREEFSGFPHLISRLRAIPMWPAAGVLQPLADLYIPGGFDDPLKLAALVDIDALGGRKEFLEDLGVKPLTFENYVREQVPQVFRANPDLPKEGRRGLVQLLTRKLGEIHDNEELRQMLGGLPLIECIDGEFRAARLTYAHSNIAAFLADQIHIAASDAQDTEALKALYEWLGVAQEPRPKDVLARLHAMPAVPDPQSRQLVQSVFEYLVGQWAKWENDKKQPYADLCALDWLPGRDALTQWYKPGLLHAVFQEYLYASQAVFLDLPPWLQQQASTVKMIEFLGINVKPTVRQVVNHVKECSDDKTVINYQVYRFLSDNVDDPIVAELKGTACLYLPQHGYILPRQVFWGEHPFGPYRYRLGTELRLYQPLFDELDVREAPEDLDYLDVIREICERFDYGHHPLDDEAYGVFMRCWERMSDALEAQRISPEELHKLSDSKVIADNRRILTAPRNLFFEDRAGLAAKFPQFLDHSVIARPLGAWRAMEAAGVRPLSQALIVHLLEPPDDVVDTFLTERVAQRRLLIARAVESVKTRDSGDVQLSALDELRFYRAAQLRVAFSIKAFRREEQSAPESLQALLLPNERRLLSVHSDGDVPWTAVARELAFAMRRDGEIGPLAGGIKEALANPTLTGARNAMDELGYPPLQEYVHMDPKENETITVIGSGTDTIEHQPDGEPPNGDSGSSKNISAQDAVEGILGNAGATRPPMPEGPVEGTPGSDGGDGMPVPGRPNGKHPSRGKLRTYVIPADNRTASDTGRQMVEHNMSVDAAGISRVLEYEHSEGRTPVEMPHFHEGYDVESTNATGRLRYIEVKSLSGIWTEHAAAGLTAAQFETGRELGEQFWLYVVESATSDDYRITCIQDPVRRIDQHLYDDGWRKLADESHEPTLAG